MIFKAEYKFHVFIIILIAYMVKCINNKNNSTRIEINKSTMYILT